MKIGVVFFHKNIMNIYSKRWIDKSIESILNQSNKSFSLYELNYGGEFFSLFDGVDNYEKHFYSENLINYAEAMNFIITKSFEDGCDYVFNTNLDDYYHTNRISEQLNMMSDGSYDILSSDFCYISENVTEDDIIRYMNITQYVDIQKNLESNHNVIAHPAVCYSKKFWMDEKNRYDSTKVPEEDLDLWIRAIKNEYKFGIHPSVLLYYRIHKNQVSYKNER